jgi:hypothetical protein
MRAVDAECIVEVRGAPRENAAAKDSAWVSARGPLEELKAVGTEEIILQNKGGALLEGSQVKGSARVWKGGSGLRGALIHRGLGV